MLGLSPEHSHYLRSFKCPLCGKRSFRLTAQTADGRPVRSLELAYVMPGGRSAVVTCPKCQGQWPVFAGEVAESATAAPGPIRIRETGRVEEPFLDDDREFDNRGSTTATKQTIAVSEQWTQTVQLEREQTRTDQEGGTLGAGQVASVTAQVEEALRTNYSISESQQRTFSSQLEIEVPPHTRRRVELHYRRIMQTGVAEVPTAAGPPLEVPFRVALNLTLDWAQHDEVSSG